jgi:hypothetical protein
MGAGAAMKGGDIAIPGSPGEGRRG